MKPDTRRALDFIAGAIHELCAEAYEARQDRKRTTKLHEANQATLERIAGTLEEHGALLGTLIHDQAEAGQRCSDRECKCRERFQRLEQLAAGARRSA